MLNIPPGTTVLDLFIVLKTVNETLSGNDDYEKLVVNPDAPKPAQFTVAGLVRYTLKPN